jgi:VCBS repeat-containing protein
MSALRFVTCLLVVGFVIAAPSADAATTGMVDLGHASTYAALSGASVGNTVSAPGAVHTTLHGDLGVKASAQPTGFPPGVVTGTTNVGNPAAAQAHADLVTAYSEVALRTSGTARAGDLTGATIAPGLYTIGGAVANTGTVTLDAAGDPNAVFVFQVGGALALAAGSHVVLAGGAQASHVFWQVNGAGSIGANATFAGTLMALDAVAIGNGTSVNGRLLARNGAVTLDADVVYSARPVVTIAGGAAVSTTDTTPTISGTTDIDAPGVVTVTVSGQTFTVAPVAGAWSVTSAILSNATYPVVASVTDGAGNVGTAIQQLTVDTVPPVLAIDGGDAVITNDATPTISGTSDMAAGTVVHVVAGTQTLSALVQASGTWNVTAAPLADGPHTVTASVVDAAGNPGGDSQLLTVDTVPPALSIAGGAHALTRDATPTISGVAAVPAGTGFSVTLADETLTGSTRAGGAWSVTAAMLADGPHRVVVRISDAAGNTSTLTQTLTVDTVAPTVAITGGSSATTADLTPTLTGTSGAAPGTTVSVSIAGQTMTTVVQASHTWNVTPSSVGKGTWTVVATAPDPAGNVGRATQRLRIGTASSGGGGGGGGAPDATAKTTITPSGHQRFTGSSPSIAIRVAAPPAGRVVATARGTVRIAGVKKAITLATSTARVAAGRAGKLHLRPKGTSRVAKAASKTLVVAVRRGRKVTATVAVKLVDAAGHTRTVTRTVRLTKR